MVLPVHLRLSAVVAIVDCPDRSQFIGSRSLKQAAPQSIWLFQESLNRAGMVLACDTYVDDDNDLRKRADEFMDGYFEFRSFVEECAIYFPEETVRAAMKLGDLMFNLSVEIRYHSTPADAKRLIQRYKAAEKDIESSNKQIRQYLEWEFRKMLGAGS